MWVARNRNNSLYMFYDKPYRENNWRWVIDSKDLKIIELKDEGYPQFKDLKWDDEPIEVELCQVFNSREHNMLNLLKKAYDIANDGSNPFNNDATGSSFCWEIKNMITPIMERIQKDIDIYDIKD